MLQEIENIKNGENSYIVVEDPFGHSTIIHKDITKTKLREEEIKDLKIGFIM